MAAAFAGKYLFAILVAVAIVTTAAAMPIYRASLPESVERASASTAVNEEPATPRPTATVNDAPDPVGGSPGR
jgi:hypothetical protein